jgi:hypothetical protein
MAFKVEDSEEKIETTGISTEADWSDWIICRL